MEISTLSKIDVHHHSLPPVYIDYLERQGRSPAGWVRQPWTLELDCDFCEASNISKAILSCIPGGPSLENDFEEARQFTRECNDYNAQIRNTSPQKYGFFAHISSLCDSRLTLEEISYAFDTLHADGITLATHYEKDCESYYLGHEDFIPIWDNLSARKAIVFVHPVPSADKTVINKNLPAPAYDFPHETGRAAVDMITNSSNMLQKHAIGCAIILSHAGGDLPYLIDRTAGLMSSGPSALRLAKTIDEMLDAARCFYYDTALSSSPMHLSALISLLGPKNLDHLLFGSDFPPGGVKAIAYFTQQLETSKYVDLKDLRANALKLFPTS